MRFFLVTSLLYRIRKWWIILEKLGNNPLKAHPHNALGEGIISEIGVHKYSSKARSHDWLVCLHFVINFFTVSTAHSAGLEEWWWVLEKVTIISRDLQKSMKVLLVKFDPLSMHNSWGIPCSLKMQMNSFIDFSAVWFAINLTRINLDIHSTTIRYNLPSNLEISLAKLVQGLLLGSI